MDPLFGFAAADDGFLVEIVSKTMIHMYVRTYVHTYHTYVRTYLPGRKAQVNFACLHIPRRKTPGGHESFRKQ